MSEEPQSAISVGPLGSSDSELIFGLRRATAVRVRALPRPAPTDDAAGARPSDDGATTRLAMLAAGHATRKPVVWVWHRGRARGPVELLAAGARVLPARTVTEPVPPGGLWERMQALPAWSSVTLRPDGLVADEHRRGRVDDQATRSIEETLLDVWAEPFTLLLIAEPVEVAGLRDVISAIDASIRFSSQQEKNWPSEVMARTRAEARLREFREADSLGVWWARLLVGGTDPDAVRAIAGIVPAAVDLGDLPYVLVPSTQAGAPFDRAFSAALTEAEVLGTNPEDQLNRSVPAPGLISSRLLAALTRPPGLEVPGIRLVTSPDFDITPEIEHGGSAAGDDAAKGTITVGTVLDRRKEAAGSWQVSLSSLNRHLFICGATGSGKSNSTRTIAEALTVEAGVPWLVVEPAKAEYKAMGARLADHPGGDVIVIRPGDQDAPAAGIDPLRPAPGFPLQTHIDLVRALFLAAFDAQEPFPQILSAALVKAYEDAGWNVASGTPRRRGHRPLYPTLADLEETALHVVSEIGYGDEIRDNVTGFIRVRLGSLRLGNTGRFLHRTQPINIAKLLRSNVVLELEELGDDKDKAFVMGVILIALTEHLRVEQRARPPGANRLRQVTVFEEAHRLFRAHTDESAGAKAVEMFASLLAEIRAYGTGVIVAEQIPSKIIADVIKNTSVKIMHRLPAADDRASVGATMNLSESQSHYVVTLPPGEAAAFADGMDHPVLVRLPDGTKREAGRQHLCGAEDLVEPSFGRCAADYGTHGMTADVLARGEVLAADEADIVGWAELTTVAFLSALVAPRPPARLRQLLLDDAPVGYAAVVTAVDDAVAVRAAAICDRVDPRELAPAVAASMWRAVNGTATEPAERACWWATPFRFDPAADDLEAALSVRHDEEHLHRLRHLRQLVRMQRASLYTPATIERILYGSMRASALEEILGCHRHDPRLPHALIALERRFDTDWVVGLLDLPQRLCDREMDNDVGARG